MGDLGRNPVEWADKKRAYLGQRAIDTCTYTLICNSVGNVRDRAGSVRKFGGGALLLGTDGAFIARSSSTHRRPHMVVADLNIKRLRRLRANSFFQHHRPQVYVNALEKAC